VTSPAIKDVPPDIVDAMWRGDTDYLDEVAPCRCCCHEHTFDDCPARTWSACRGQYAMTRAETASWKDHYALFHGMSEARFYGFEPVIACPYCGETGTHIADDGLERCVGCGCH
jgi:hypothetical protein